MKYSVCITSVIPLCSLPFVPWLAPFSDILSLELSRLSQREKVFNQFFVSGCLWALRDKVSLIKFDPYCSVRDARTASPMQVPQWYLK